jgi:hypothetical protein
MSERRCWTCKYTVCRACAEWDSWEPKDDVPPRREITQIACCSQGDEWELFGLSEGSVWVFNGHAKTPPWTRLPDLPQE